MIDKRSEQASAYRKLYKTARWLARRARQLRDKPLCERCERRGRIAPATVADHVKPHRGDVELFFRGALQSLCDSCHSSAKQSEESRGYSREIGSDGWPVDPKHPANRKLG
jgi:5-methylcytosine-specific restriction protein A